MTERYEDDFEDDIEDLEDDLEEETLDEISNKTKISAFARAKSNAKYGPSYYGDESEKSPEDFEKQAARIKSKIPANMRKDAENAADIDARGMRKGHTPGYDRLEVKKNFYGTPKNTKIMKSGARKGMLSKDAQQARVNSMSTYAKSHKKANLPEEATSSAAETLSPNSKPTNLDSKTGLMAAAMAAIGGMSKEDLSHFLNDALAQIGQEAANIDGGAAAKNAATIQMKPSAAGSAVKEDLDELFGEDLSEEFKDQASTLFEAAVQARIIVETAALEEAYEEALNEHMEEITASLVEKVDDYLTYVAEQWVAENEVAIESALKVEVMEDFVNGLKDLFVENYIEIPSGKTDVLEDLVLTVEELEEKLNSVLSENIELKKELNEKVIDDTFETVAEGLAATQIEKLRTLAEGVDYNSVEDYKKKLTLIRGKLVENKRVSTNIITEEAPAHDSEFEDAPKSGFIDSDVRNYVSAISRTVKK